MQFVSSEACPEIYHQAVEPQAGLRIGREGRYWPVSKMRTKRVLEAKLKFGVTIVKSTIFAVHARSSRCRENHYLSRDRRDDAMPQQADAIVRRLCIAAPGSADVCECIAWSGAALYCNGDG